MLDKTEDSTDHGAMRRALTYYITFPLVILGLFVAHQASYYVVHGTDAPKVLADTGHGYLQHLPLALIVCLITSLSFVAADAVWSALTRRPVTKLPVWPFLLTGPVTFTVQEHVERYQATGQLPWSVTLEATFLVGLLLQVPTALLIYFMARQVMSTARHAIAKVVDRCRRPGDYPKSEPESAPRFVDVLLVVSFRRSALRHRRQPRPASRAGQLVPHSS